MTLRSRSAALLLALVVGPVTETAALVPGGGSKKSDCYAEWLVTTDTRTPSSGVTKVDCEDGDPTCDVDATMDGVCTFGVSICVPFVANVTGCTPQTVTQISLNKKSQKAGFQLPPLPASASVCGPATLVSLALKSTKSGQKPSKKAVFQMKARADVKPKADPDKLILRCVPNAGVGQCLANPNGGARAVQMTVPGSGTDLDNGWTGISHNFPVVRGATIQMCLQGCDVTANSQCTEEEMSTEQTNGAFFGAPIPLLAAGVPVCLVNRFGSPKLTGGAVDLLTGGIAANINLLSSVYLSSATQLCPRCSGNDVGKTGICDSGPQQGRACRTGGVVTVSNAPGNTLFTTSADCLPTGPAAGVLTIGLSLTTGTSTLNGPKPCGASQDDQCGGGASCSAPCTGPACVSTTASGQCVDAKGGLSQLCCSNDTTRPCFPTAGGGQIVRTGSAAPPTPVFPDPTYPKTGSEVLVATFCESATGSSVVNATTGLPGPGALILPVDTTWVR